MCAHSGMHVQGPNIPLIMPVQSRHAQTYKCRHASSCPSLHTQLCMHRTHTHIHTHTSQGALGLIMHLWVFSDEVMYLKDFCSQPSGCISTSVLYTRPSRSSAVLLEIYRSSLWLSLLPRAPWLLLCWLLQSCRLVSKQSAPWVSSSSPQRAVPASCYVAQKE